VGEVALIRHTISHYSPVLIALLSNQFPRAGVKKKKSASPARTEITSLLWGCLHYEPDGASLMTSWLPTVLNANGVPLAHFLR
jgi:hypothetical protein